MAMNLTIQVRSISAVTKAVAAGDLTQKVDVDVQGEMLELKLTVNTMVDQLGAFSSEVTRVAMEVGTRGILGGQARVPDVKGTWAELTNNVNVSGILHSSNILLIFCSQTMATNLTLQVRSISAVTKAVAAGNLTQKVDVDVQGEMLELRTTINTMVDQLSTLANEVTRVSLEVGTDGILGGQAYVPGVQGTWKALTQNVNLMAENLTTQVRQIASVTKAVAKGDMTKKIDVDVKGEILELKDTVNGMTDSLSIFAKEVTRVAREVGTEGILGGRAEVEGVAGIWKDLTERVNLMARNVSAFLFATEFH